MNALFGESVPIYYDENSQYGFHEILETKFITRVLTHLRDHLGDRFPEFEWWLFSNLDGKAVPASAARVSDKPKVLIWLSDEWGVQPTHIHDQYLAVFKVCLPNPDENPANVFDFPLGVLAKWDDVPYKTLEERDISVYFDGNLNKNRAPIYQALTPLLQPLPDKLVIGLLAVVKRVIPRIVRRDFSDRFPGARIIFNLGFNSGDKKSYVDCLSSAQIALCPAGFFGPETFRHLEAMRAGCIIISPQLPNKYLYEGSPIIQVSNWREGLKAAEKLLQDPDKMEELHQATLDWWENVCSEQATARYVAEKVISVHSSQKVHS